MRGFSAEPIYQYDLANRLTNVISKASGSSVLAARYDGLGRRVEVTRNGSSVEQYVYFPGSFLVLAILDGSNVIKEFYTHGPDLSGTVGGAGGIGGILAVVSNSDPEPVEGWFHYDGNGNVVRLTDANRDVISTLEYGPFGTVLVKSGPYTPRYQFSSKEFDGAVGLNYYGFRYYSPQLGRWLSRDPIAENGGINLYQYCANNPVNYIDPDGLRVINSSDRTIPVVVNEKLPGGKQGPQEILYLPPGGDTDVLKPGWDTDGIFPPSDNTRVIKLVGDVIAEVLRSGGVRLPWYNNPIDTGLQLIFGGWKDEAFLNQWKWPRPDPDKCK